MARSTIDVQELIERINASERARSSTHFSDMVYRGEPIVRTGRQMANYLPDRYREMRSISRYQARGDRGRWLSEAELFYRQARFMEDFEDDCPYHGRFASYYPTYNNMSDQQLRGYFTWRTAVRRGDIQPTCLSFAYLHLYELICGIGVTSPLDGFAQIKSFWQAYRAFEPSLDRYARVWLHDYVVYHGLDPHLLADHPAVESDAVLVRLLRASAPFDPALGRLLDGDAATQGGAPQKDTPQNDVPFSVNPRDARASATTPSASSVSSSRTPTLPLPPDSALENELIDALAAASTYRIKNSRLWRTHEDDLRHVACAVYVRMLGYYRKNRTHGFIESSFGEEAEMGYTMFASAVFFEEQRHADTTYRLDPIRSYRCRNGMWTCRRIYGGRDKSASFGTLMKTIDARLRLRLGFEPALKEPKAAKYLVKIIDKEIETWLEWKAAHAPRHIEIDLSQLAHIRSAAAETREALLIDEEREGEGRVVPCSNSALRANCARDDAPLPNRVEEDNCPSQPSLQLDANCKDNLGNEAGSTSNPASMVGGSAGGGGSCPPARSSRSAVRAREDTSSKILRSSPIASADPPSTTTALSPVEHAYLAALLEGGAPIAPAGMSEDMLVDTINEHIFDLVGDTVIEFGPNGPCLIEDYRDDIREVIHP